MNRVARARLAVLAGCTAALLGSLGLAGPVSASITTHGTAAAGRPGGPSVAIGTGVVPPRGTTDIGVAPANARVPVDVVLKPRNPAALTAFATEVSTPGSALYQHYLRKGQAMATFGPTPGTVRAVRATLTRLGLHVGRTAADAMVIPVTGTIGQYERAFGVRMRAFRLASGAVADANVTAPRLPAATARAVQGIVGLDGLFRLSPSLSRAPRPSRPTVSPSLVSGQAAPCAKATGTGDYTGPEIAQAYDMDPLYNVGDFGGDVNADLVEMAPYNSADITAYQKCYGTSVSVIADALTGGLGSNSTEDEVDIEDLISLAPQIGKIFVYEAPDNLPNGAGYGIITILDEIVGVDNARVISDSWGGCETQAGNAEAAQSEEPLLEMIAAQGQSFFSATGDSGSEECAAGSLGVQDPSSQPFVTAVGGTNLNGLGNPPAVAPSENTWASGGGGISSVWPMQGWQLHSTPGVINKYSTNKLCGAPSGDYCRELPDVSANAGLGYAVYIGNGSGYWWGIDGTSLATPTWAAITALIDASSSSCSKKPVGLFNFDLYKLAASTPEDINDITSGNNANGDPALHGVYPATKGYDQATGLGTPEAANLAQSVCGTNPLWTPQATIPGSYTPGVAPATATSGHTLYVATTNSAGDIIYQSFNGTTWSSVQQVTIDGSPVTTGFSPGIAVSDGKLSVAWTNSSHFIDVSTLSGGTWSSPVVIAGGKAESNHGPALSGSGDDLYAAWKGNSTDNIYLSIYDGSSWSAQQQVTGASTPSRPAVTFFPALAAVIIAWQTSSDTVQYEDFGILGFGGVATVPQAGTNETLAVDVVGNRLYVAWKGHTTDKIFYKWQADDKKIFGTWTGQLTEPAALTDEAVSIAATGPTMYTVWTGQAGLHLWYQFADVPQ